MKTYDVYITNNLHGMQERTEKINTIECNSKWYALAKTEIDKKHEIQSFSWGYNAILSKLFTVRI